MPKSDLPFGDEEYTPVAERVALFYERYPTGRIITRLVSRTRFEITVKAMVYRWLDERRPSATGLASERIGDGDINTVACLENTETSAVGRALANLGLSASPQRLSRERLPTANRPRLRPREVSAREPRAPDARERVIVRRVPRAVDASVQRRADHAAEILVLIAHGTRLGLSAAKARVLRDRLTRPDVDFRLLTRIDRRLRDWLDRRVAGLASRR